MTRVLGLDRVLAGAERLRHVVDGQVGVVEQHDRRAHPRREAVDAGEQGQPPVVVGGARGTIRHDVDLDDARRGALHAGRAIGRDPQLHARSRSGSRSWSPRSRAVSSVSTTTSSAASRSRRNQVRNALDLAAVPLQEVVEDLRPVATQGFDGHLG
jgi:hypothetical protein